MQLDEVFIACKKHMGNPDWVVKSPCRVNIIGEHTDYNRGYVLPFAADRYIYFMAKRNSSDHITFYSCNLNAKVRIPIQPVAIEKDSWYRYFQSAMNLLQKENKHMNGLEILFGGNIPAGAGLSSSSSITCGFIYLMNEIFSWGISKIELVSLSAKAERNTGLHGGEMDQFTVIFGETGNGIFLDCQTFEYELIPLNLDSCRFVLFNSNVKHNLLDTDYNVRRQECRTAYESIRVNHPEVKNMRELTPELIDEIRISDPTGHRRLAHFVSENSRVKKIKHQLLNGDLNSVGDTLLKSHQSLRDDYEVSCPELDFLVNKSTSNPNLLGCRMMGGGFGGCTINLVKNGVEEDLYSCLSATYLEKFNNSLDMYVVKAVNGIEVI